jgi:hypothetical protein
VNQNAATTSAFLIAPIVAGAAFSLLMFDVTWWFIVWFFVCYLLSVAFVLLLGLPIFLLLGRLGLVNWWAGVLGGFVGGACIPLLLGVWNGNARAVLIYGLIGAATGLAFWSIWRLGPEPNESGALNWARHFFVWRK